MTDYQRIEEVLKYCGLNARTLADILELKSPQPFYDIKAGKCGISKGLAYKIKDKFFNLSVAWLLTGEGDMLIEPMTDVIEISGDDNMTGVSVSQTISENRGQNAGRDINNPPCHYSEKLIMAEIEAQRKLTEKQFEFYAASLEKKDNQIQTAQLQIDTLIKQNKEQFDRLVSLLANK